MTYKLIRRRGQKNLRMHFDSKGNLVVSVPFFTPSRVVENFVNSNHNWIDTHRPSDNPVPQRLTHGELEEKIRNLVDIKSKEIKVCVDNVKFYNARSYWGICYPRKGLVKFSFRCCNLSDEQIEYVVIHELCHLVHPDHGKAFWSLVLKYSPNFREIRKEIKKIR